jgi:uncharacterized protein (TIGR02118 family)
MSIHKLIALYKKPADAAAFDAHYQNVHLPLVQKIPGLTRTVLNRGTSPPWGGDSAYYLIAEMHFADEASFKAAMLSGENRAAGKDIRSFAEGLVTLVTAIEE